MIYLTSKLKNSNDIDKLKEENLKEIIIRDEKLAMLKKQIEDLNQTIQNNEHNKTIQTITQTIKTLKPLNNLKQIEHQHN